MSRCKERMPCGNFVQSGMDCEVVAPPPSPHAGGPHLAGFKTAY